MTQAMQDLGSGRVLEAPRLVDPFGRRVRYLRVSVIDRCDLRCVYCMAEHMSFLPKAGLLTLEEMTGSAAPSSSAECASCASPAASPWCVAGS